MASAIFPAMLLLVLFAAVVAVRLGVFPSSSLIPVKRQ